MLNELIHNEKNTVIQKLENLHDIKLGLLRTSKDDLERYDELKLKCNHVNSKKRKKMNLEMNRISSDNKYFNEDYAKLLDYKTKIAHKHSLETQLNNINNYIDSEVNVHLNILKTNKFITSNENKYTLLETGKYAIGLNEIHSLAVAECFYNKIFSDLNLIELACVLSVFCDIRLQDQDKIFNVDSAIDNIKITGTVKKIKKSYDKYYDIETHYQTEFMFNYELQYDLIEIVHKWYNCKDENECIHILNEAKQWGIEIGNFNKAIMKICNIVNELEGLCLIQENVDLKHRLHDIPGNIMKFVINNQSLYL